MFNIQIQNVEKVERFLIELPKRIDKELTRTNEFFIDWVVEGAKVRAPVDTGGLKESIKKMPVRRGKNVKQWKIVVGSPHALFQEEGFTPHSFFAGADFNSSYLSPGGVFFVSKWTPFLKPALREQLKTFDDKLNNAMRRAIKI